VQKRIAYQYVEWRKRNWISVYRIVQKKIAYQYGT